MWIPKQSHGTGTVVAEAALHGSYGLKLSTDGTVAAETKALANLGSSYTDVYARCYMKFLGLPTGYDFWNIISMLRPDWIPDVGIRLYGPSRSSANQVEFGVGYLKNGALAWLTYGPVGANRMYCIELHLKEDVTNGAVDLYIDNNHVLGDSGFGNGHSIQQVQYNLYVGNAGSPHTIYVDDIVVANTYIGAIPPASTPSVTSPPSTNQTTPPYVKTNLAAIPNDWYLTYGNGKQIIFLDSTVVRTSGKPSIRLEPHTANDMNRAREVDGIWYPIKPGDHIVAKCWMRVLTGPSTYGYPYCGARIGIDFDGYDGDGKYVILDAAQFWKAYYQGDFSRSYVRDSNGGAWQQRTIDIIVPATVGDTLNRPCVPDTMVLWMQGAPWIINPTASNVWFADAELYINP